MEFGAYLTKLRKQYGLSQEQCAHAIGYRHRSAMCLIEGGRQDMTIEQLTALAKLFKLQPWQILYGHSQETAEMWHGAYVKEEYDAEKL